MTIIFPILFNIIAVVGFYILEKKTSFSRLKNITKQLIIGMVFGAISISGNELGWEVAGTKMNVRDSGPLSAGLIFGWQSGIIAGLIGGGFRALSVLWGAGEFTVVACSISTCLAGVVAAILRKYMFDDKKPTWLYAFGIAVVMEIFHMLMIFLTNMDEANLAFTVVRACTIPMAVLNAVTVGVSVLLVTLMSKEKIRREKGKEQIAQTFQRWLVITILIAFIITSLFTFDLQTGMREAQIEDTFKTTMSDVIKDIKGKSDDTLRKKAEEVKKDYISYNENAEILPLLAQRVGVCEINIIDETGIIVASTDEKLAPGGEDEYFDMSSTQQSSAFMVLVGAEEDTTFVQGYGAMGLHEETSDNKIMRKYAGVTLPDGGFLQVGYNEKQFHENLDPFVIDFTKNRSVGTNGFVAVCDNQFHIVAETAMGGRDISAIGIIPNEEMSAKKTASEIYKAEIVNEETNYKETYLYVFTFAEEYCVIVAMPQDDVMLLRDASAYLSIFMQVLTFAGLFVLLYFLIKKLVIDNIHKINGTLSKISSGNLNEMVDVRSNVEFASLSDDINTTVDALKQYIKEAAARIDKELEYAKQIQLSALPNNFPNESEYEIYAQMIAAKEVGGDFYDFYKLSDNTVAILVADVSGKGIPAAMFMMTAKTIIKDLAERGLSVNEIFTQANAKLCENNESGMFVTAWMGILDTTTGKLTYANAGHNPPVLYRNGSFEYLKSRAGFVLAGMEGIVYRLNELILEKGDRIFLYTDGVTEATNESTELYGEDRLLAFINDNKALSPTELLPALKKDIDQFVGDAPQFDDITMLLFDYKEEKGEKKVAEKSFPAKTESLSDVLGFIEEQLEAYDCPMKTTMAVCVAIEEVFVNVANYAYPNGEGEVKMTTTFDEGAREVVFEMSDKGIPFDPLKKPDPDVTLSVEEREIGGLGIFITKKTMDEVLYRYENGENILTMIKKI